MAAKLLPEFFSQWHQDRYVSDMKNDLRAAEARLEELKALGLDEKDPALVGAEARVANAHKELRRLGAEKAAKK